MVSFMYRRKVIDLHFTCEVFSSQTRNIQILREFNLRLSFLKIGKVLLLKMIDQNDLCSSNAFLFRPNNVFISSCKIFNFEKNMRKLLLIIRYLYSYDGLVQLVLCNKNYSNL